MLTKSIFPSVCYLLAQREAYPRDMLAITIA